MDMQAVRRDDATESLYAAIGAFLEAHGLGPDPAHYAFAHAALTDPATAAAVARLTDGRVRLGREQIEALGGHVRPRNAAPHADSRRAADLVARTQAQVDGFADLVRDLHEETQDFGRDLAASAAAIRRRPAIDGLDEIARLVGTMTARVRDGEARLAVATAEADGLRGQLAHAQAEARRDPLTGLPNRLALEEQFAARCTAGPVCLAVVDIDHFKQLNDRHGHGVGDRVLHAIAQALATDCADHLVARHGGEEFVVLTCGPALAEAASLLDRARGALGARRFRDRDTGAALGRVTLSAGVVALAAGESLDAALARADRLLYTAKADGRDRVCAG